MNVLALNSVSFPFKDYIRLKCTELKHSIAKFIIIMFSNVKHCKIYFVLMHFIKDFLRRKLFWGNKDFLGTFPLILFLVLFLKLSQVEKMSFPETMIDRWTQGDS